MVNNIKGELMIMDNLDIKPNYAALGRKYGMVLQILAHIRTLWLM